MLLKYYILLKLYITILFLAVPNSFLIGQSFEKHYDLDNGRGGGRGGPGIITSDGGFLICGDNVVRLNQFGDTLWTWNSRYFNGSITRPVEVNDGYLLTNESTLIKIDNSGKMIWTKSYPNIGRISRAILTQDSSFIISTTSTGNLGGILKTDLNGDTLWTFLKDKMGVRSITETTRGMYAYPRSDSNLWETIDSTGKPGKNALNLVNMVGYEILFTKDQEFLILGTNLDRKIFLIKANLNGDTIWTKLYQDKHYSSRFGGFTSGRNDQGVAFSYMIDNLGVFIETDNLGNVAKREEFQETSSRTDFYLHKKENKYLLSGTTNVNGLSMLVAVIDDIPTSSLSTLHKSTEFEIFPNPASQNVNIAFNELQKELNLTIYSSLGNIVKSFSFLNINAASLELGNLSPGSYYLIINNGKNISNVKPLIIR